MRNSRPEERAIVIRHKGRLDYAEVLFNILKYYAEYADINCAAAENGGRQGGGLTFGHAAPGTVATE
jgi:hypothetical protein